MSEGIKHDEAKVKLELLSRIWIEGVGSVLTFGAKKYAAHNWRKGISRSRLMGAALRHCFAYLEGEDCDPETKLSHLFHASCCLMFASELHVTHPETDDRYSSAVKKVAVIDESKCDCILVEGRGDRSTLMLECENLRRKYKGIENEWRFCPCWCHSK